jgi:serine phosphatase RsbU (regulator of sigma subunit)
MLEKVATAESENRTPIGLKPDAAPDTELPIEAGGTSVAGQDDPTGLCSLISHRFSLTADTPLEVAHKFFSSHDLEFVAVLDGDCVLGLCARRQIGIVMGSRYGFALFSRNPVRDYLAAESLVIRTGDPIHQVLERVSSRRDEDFYDDVLLVDTAGGFLGSIFVRNLVRLQHGLLLKNIQQLETNRHEIERKNGQMEQELILAGRVQQAMLPQSSMETGALRFYHRYLPAGRVSGDFFHVRRISEQVAGAFVCDVMGHGVRSAMITAMMRALVEELQSEAGQPGELLERLNCDLHSILNQNDESMYASAIYMVIDTASHQIRWASAGHPCPLHLCRHDGRVEPLSLPKEKRGKVLGLFEDSIYPTCEAPLQPGDILLLFTDGVYEVFRGKEEFGVDGVMATVRQNLARPVSELLDRILDAARVFGDIQNFEDDVCLLAIETVPDQPKALELRVASWG